MVSKMIFIIGAYERVTRKRLRKCRLSNHLLLSLYIFFSLESEIHSSGVLISKIKIYFFLQFVPVWSWVLKISIICKNCRHRTRNFETSLFFGIFCLVIISQQRLRINSRLQTAKIQNFIVAAHRERSADLHRM